MSVQAPWEARVEYCSIGAKPGVTIDVTERLLAPMAWRAAPKSSNTGEPSFARRMMLAGLMSRCRNSAPCTTSSALSSASRRPLSSLSLSFPFRFRWADRLSPST